MLLEEPPAMPVVVKWDDATTNQIIKTLLNRLISGGSKTGEHNLLAMLQQGLYQRCDGMYFAYRSSVHPDPSLIVTCEAGCPQSQVGRQTTFESVYQRVQDPKKGQRDC